MSKRAEPRKTKAQKLEEKRDRQAAERKAKAAADSEPPSIVADEDLAELKKQLDSCGSALEAKRKEVATFIKAHTNRAVDEESPSFNTWISAPFLGVDRFALNEKIKTLRTQRDLLTIKKARLRKQFEAAENRNVTASTKKVEKMLEDFAAQNAKKFAAEAAVQTGAAP